MLALIRLALFTVLMGSAPSDDTVADDIGVHMMGRISELLSPEECQAFYAEITGPEENVEEELERLSEGKNPLHLRKRRDIGSTEQCKETLTHWLKAEGDTVYWDRLARALQKIGRSDVAKELGKNLNQDKNLEIKKNVEEYHETVKHLTSSLLVDENEVSGKEEGNEQERLRRDGEGSQIKSEESSDWDEFEVTIERQQLPPYNRSLFEWLTPLLTGIMSGFITSFILVVLSLYSFFWTLNQGGQEPTDVNQNENYPSTSTYDAIYYTNQWLEREDASDASDADIDDDILDKEFLLDP